MVPVYAGFVAIIVALLVLDLVVLHRKAHAIGVREALGWSAFWISLGVGFAGLIYLGYDAHWFGLGAGADATAAPRLVDGVPIYNDGGSATIKYLTGFVVEKSLAVDNIFVIAMIFGVFGVPPVYQHRVLFWGIFGALLLRALMIIVGAALIARFGWVLYIFGGFLILTGVKMLLISDQPPRLDDHPVIRAVRRLVPVTERYHGEHFVLRAGSAASQAPATPGAPAEVDRVVAGARRGALLVTPLFLALVLVELTDAVFAVDSIPAIFAITTDPFLVFTSNVFAMLGLRSLYFALAGAMSSLRYLKVSLAAILVVIGGKMIAHSWLVAWLGGHFNFYVLGVVGAILAAGVIASVLVRPRPALAA
jgi:tellurite resistance protein TerC